MLQEVHSEPRPLSAWGTAAAMAGTFTLSVVVPILVVFLLMARM